MMADERTKVFRLLDEAEKRQKTAEQQQAALKDLLQANQTAAQALDQGLSALRRRHFWAPEVNRRCSHAGSNRRQKSSSRQKSSVKLSMGVFRRRWVYVG